MASRMNAVLTVAPPTGLSPDIAEKYAAIIDDILENADLNTISAKRIRKGLQERLGHDISGEKVPTCPCILPPPTATDAH